MNAVVAVQKTRTSIPPNSSDEMVDQLFSESKLPPPDATQQQTAQPAQGAQPGRVEPDSEQMIVVEEDIDLGNATNESPTSRPPPADAEPIMLQKGRQAPSVPNVPAARRR